MAAAQHDGNAAPTADGRQTSRPDGSDLTLPVARYRYEFRAEDDLRLPPYAGSAWRGAFGHALGRAVCVMATRDCVPCALRARCAYPYLFETPPGADSARLRKYPHAPHPYVLRPHAHGRHLAAGAVLALDCVLIGHANRHAALIAHTLRCAGAAGLTHARARLVLRRVVGSAPALPEAAVWDGSGAFHAVAAQAAQPPALPARLRLVLETPLRLTRNEKLIGPHDFAFHDLARNLIRRIATLSYFHADREIDADFRALSAVARNVALDRAELRWQDWTRHSTRQDRAIDMGGVLGTLELDGTQIAPFWPWLWLGQWVHAGKGTVMGLGAYRIEAADSAGVRSAPGAGA